jgi:hypothetical protein
MLSQPATKIFFKTSEPHAARWISDAIGEVEVERLKESRTVGLLRSKKSFTIEIATKPLVMPSQIAGLEPLHAYIKQGNRVVPAFFPYQEPMIWQPGLIKRKMPELAPRLVLEPAPAAAPVTTNAERAESPKDPAKKVFWLFAKMRESYQNPETAEWDESKWIG